MFSWFTLRCQLRGFIGKRSDDGSWASSFSCEVSAQFQSEEGPGSDCRLGNHCQFMILSMLAHTLIQVYSRFYDGYLVMNSC